MTTMVISLQANKAAWEADRAVESVRCTTCRAVYPGRLMAQVVDGICKECCGKHDETN